MVNFGESSPFRALFSSGTELWALDPSNGSLAVKDIEAGTGNSNPELLTNVNGTLYFAASTSDYGQELWKIDPVTGNSIRVTDIVPSTGSSSPFSLTNADGTLYFTLNNSIDGSSVWKIDPITGAPFRVTTIASSTGSSFPEIVGYNNGKLYLNAEKGVNGRELWVLDVVNDAPIVALPLADQTIAEDSPFTFTLPANSFTDVALGDSLPYSITQSNGQALPSWLTFNAATRTLSGTPQAATPVTTSSWAPI